MESKTGLDKEFELMDFYFSKKDDSPNALFSINYLPLETIRKEFLRKNIVARINRIRPDAKGKTGVYYVHNDKQDFSPEGLELARKNALRECETMYNLPNLDDQVVFGREDFLRNFTDRKEQIYRISFKELVSCLVEIVENQKG